MAHHVQCNYCQMFPPVWSRALTQALVTGPPSKSLDPDSGTVCRLHCVSLTRQSASSRNCWRLVSWRSSSTVARARARRGAVCGALFCWNTLSKSLPDTVRIAGSSMTSLWRREAVLKMSVRDITIIFCFLTQWTYRMHCRFTQQFLWRSVCGCIFEGSAATNYR